MYALHRTKLHASVIPRPLAVALGSFSECSGIFGSSVVYISLGHLRRHLLQQVAQGMFQLRKINQIRRERDVSVPRVGARRRSRHAQGVRGHDPQELCRSWSLPYIYPAIDEGRRSRPRHPLPAPSQPRRIRVRRRRTGRVSFATQTGTPPNPTMAYMTPPTTPDTPSLSYSSASPASLASPPTRDRGLLQVGEIDHSGYPTFTVNRFNIPVTYSSESFLDHNLSSLT